MQGFTAIVAVLLIAAVACASGYGGGSSSGGYGGGSSSGGYGGGSSGGQSIPAPPCPRNYLFSCQPSLQQAPCAPQSAPSSGGYGGGAAPSGGYGGAAPAQGSSGAYSENVPTYVAAPYGYGYVNGLGQGLVGGYQGLQY